MGDRHSYGSLIPAAAGGFLFGLGFNALDFRLAIVWE